MLIVSVLNSNDSSNRNTRLSSLLEFDLIALKVVASQLFSLLNAVYSGVGSNLVVNWDYKRNLPDTKPMEPHSEGPPFDDIHLTDFSTALIEFWFSSNYHSVVMSRSWPDVWDSK